MPTQMTAAEFEAAWKEVEAAKRDSLHARAALAKALEDAEVFKNAENCDKRVLEVLKRLSALGVVDDPRIDSLLELIGKTKYDLK